MLFLSIFFIHLCVLVVPGPDFLLNSRTGLTGNKKAIYQVASGTTLGAIIWACFSLLGLHVLFQYYPFLNTIILLMGGIYLLYLAYQIYRQSEQPFTVEQHEERSYFLAGLLTNLTNPKAILYFSSIFSVISFGSNSYTPLLVFIMVTIETLIWFLFIGLAFSQGTIRKFYHRYKSRIDKGSASVFVLFSLSIFIKLFVK